MAFWQASAGGWGDKLPGGAKDTMASTELAVSRANIWVIDDLAPTGDQRQTQAELARLGDLIRSVHNGSGKRRADQNMDLRATHDPRALLIITAENEHNGASVRDRIVFAPVDGLGTDEAVAAVERMRDVTGIPGRVSGRCSRTWPGSPPPTPGCRPARVPSPSAPSRSGRSASPSGDPSSHPATAMAVASRGGCGLPWAGWRPGGAIPRAGQKAATPARPPCG